MDKKTKLLVDGLLFAMKTEVEGHHFYRLAASSTQDAQGREVFEALANEELEHLEFLKKQHESVLATGKVDPNIRLGAPRLFDSENPIFSASLRERIGEAHFEMTALSVGAQLELQAQQHYLRCSAEAEDPMVQKLYAELAAWEAGHYRALTRQQQTLKEDYWSAAGFAPF